jgi:glycosyltransferase involved in cell wall biosynthesis
MVPDTVRGLSILRYAHAFASGGGMEQHLHDLDRTLLSRNPMTIVRVFLGQAGEALHKEVLPVGKGTLVKIAVPLPADTQWEQLQHGSDAGTRLRGVVRDHLLYLPPLWQLFGRRYMRNRLLPRRPGEPEGVGTIVTDALREYRVNLVMLHFLGGADSEEVLLAARRSRVPCAVENHYSNDRFNNLSIRRHVEMADAVSGINALGLPRYVRSMFHNLSNGIDMDHFQPAQPLKLDEPLRILLAARIVREKGQLDLVQACAKLLPLPLRFELTLAGRVDSAAFLAELRSEIARLGLCDRVRMPGLLSQAQLREEYAKSALVVFPTRHHEGLGRIIVEAQAMALPPVAYDIGGVAEGLVNGETGYLVRVGDINGLAARMRELLEDPALRQRMGQAGREFVQRRFSLPALAERHESFYRMVLASAGRKNAAMSL